MPVGVNPGDNGVGTTVSGAVTINHTGGNITTEPLTTAAGADYNVTITNNAFDPTSVVVFSVGNVTNTTVPVYVHNVVCGSGVCTLSIRNAGTAALNGTLQLNFTSL